MINLCHCAERSQALTYVFVQLAFQQAALTGWAGQLEELRISPSSPGRAARGRRVWVPRAWLAVVVGQCQWDGLLPCLGRDRSAIWLLNVLQDEGQCKTNGTGDRPTDLIIEEIKIH